MIADVLDACAAIAFDVCCSWLAGRRLPAILALVEAVKSGNKTAAISLLQQKADVNSRRSRRHDGAALGRSARRSSILTERLLQSGRRRQGRESLRQLRLCIWRASTATPAMIERLIKAGADANAR